jgi:molybdate transport system substrate-binding protein
MSAALTMNRTIKPASQRTRPALRPGQFALAVIVCSLIASCGPRRVSLTVSVAASLTNAITEVESSYLRDHPGTEIENNFGASGTLAREIESGAPVDVFFSAASQPMDELESRKLVAGGTRHDVLRNELVLIAPQDSHLAGFERLADPSVRTIAVGDPGSVPAGRYAEQTLAYFHLTQPVHNRLVLAKDVRQVLAYVATGNADAGLVYATDAATSSKVKIVATAPSAAHDAIVYPIAAIAASQHPAEAADFARYLSSPAAQAVFVRYGFTIAK